MSPVMDAIIRFVGGYAPAHPDLIPAKVRLSPGDFTTIVTDPTFRHPVTVPAYRIIGLEVVYDGTLPPGVWRVATSDDTLIYDNRQQHPIEATP